MTIATLLDRTTKLLDSRVNRQVETVHAVADAQLWEILQSHGLLSDLDAGRLHCYVTGVPLTRDNVGGMLISPDGPRLIADTYAALSAGQPESSAPSRRTAIAVG
jgi:hypothetical protein